MFSASNQRTRTRQPWCTPECFSASCTERYASCSFTYLPTSAISTSPSSAVDPLDERAPLLVGAARRVEPELVEDERVEPLLLEHRRNEVDVAHVRARDHGLHVDVGEERDLVADVRARAPRSSGDDDVRVDTDAAQLVHRVLRRLRLQLAGGLDERDERHVQVEHVLGPDLAAELADRLEERQRLDVADGAADLADHDVRGRRPAALRMRRLISSVMCGITCTVAPRNSPLRSLRMTFSQIAPAVWLEPGEVRVDEALVVAEVEIGLGAVLGDEHLAVLERAHRARVDVEIRVELLRLTSSPRAFSSRPSEAAAMPFPSADTTPPVTKTYFVTGVAPTRRRRVARACVRSTRRASVVLRGG